MKQSLSQNTEKKDESNPKRTKKAEGGIGQARGAPRPQADSRASNLPCAHTWPKVFHVADGDAIVAFVAQNFVLQPVQPFELLSTMACGQFTGAVWTSLRSSAVLAAKPLPKPPSAKAERTRTRWPVVAATETARGAKAPVELSAML